MKRLLGQHSPADGTPPEVPAAGYTASTASPGNLFGTTEVPGARRQILGAGWRADLDNGQPPIRWQGPHGDMYKSERRGTQMKLADRQMQATSCAALKAAVSAYLGPWPRSSSEAMVVCNWLC